MNYTFAEEVQVSGFRYLWTANRSLMVKKNLTSDSQKECKYPFISLKKSHSSCKNEPEADECSSMAQQCVDSVQYEPSDSAINSNGADTACLSI